MKQKFFNLSACLAAMFIFAAFSFSQTPALLKRTTYKTEKIAFGAGGTLTIIGAPTGSVTVEGWNRNEIEVSAEVEVQAATEADLATLTQVDGFVLDEGFGSVRVITVGTHDKDYMKRVAKKFPKNLLTLITLSKFLPIVMYQSIPARERYRFPRLKERCRSGR
jgi:hypothetical protein